MNDNDQPILIIGSFASPYVRKVLACLELKGLAYTVDPITPFYGNDEFSRLSPLRRIPVLVQGDLALSDSSVICAWLDEAYPDRPMLLPDGTPAERARARWLEEFADSRMGDVFIWDLFFQKRVHPAVWGEPGDQARIDAAMNEKIPAILEYLEGEVPAEGYIFGDAMGLADVALATFFPNASYAGYQVDAARWPHVAGFVGRCLAHPAFAKPMSYEAALLRSSQAERRDALLAVGAPLSEVTYGLPEPRKGLMDL
ncbi:glutathione S-transferase family protein [Erythrobacter mangrovi]|uniref:Glutathione S-transferase family protein n=1 Tax=Erythrobacter mangrovi TaxID=2739433 RepID=A0A7D4CC54_9SPHN|nr:glutathione S-transferase family protein [Erythrobacter mangrovi]QKG70509.1 glutathione S-transferase family protein [Erythrobacter mangrovi]